MGIYLAQYTAAARGSVWKAVTCTECNEKYFYRAERAVAGSGLSILMLDNEGASERARKRATVTLQQELLRAVDPVPCPACGWFQAEMRGAYAATFYRWMWTVGLAFVLLATVPLAVGVVLAGDARRDREDAHLAFVVFGSLLAPGVAFLVLPHFLRVWIKPNSSLSQDERLELAKKLAFTEAQFAEAQKPRPVSSVESAASDTGSADGRGAGAPESGPLGQWHKRICENCGRRFAFPNSQPPSATLIDKALTRRFAAERRIDEEGRERIWFVARHLLPSDVPCVGCGHFQSTLSTILGGRAAKRHTSNVAAMILAALVTGGYAMVFIRDELKLRPEAESLAFVGVGGAITLGLCLALYRTHRRYRSQRAALSRVDEIESGVWIAYARASGALTEAEFKDAEQQQLHPTP